jgi:hypothetical protein
MKKVFTFIAALLFTTLTFAQEGSKVVTITSSVSGLTLEEEFELFVHFKKKCL